MRYCFLSYLRQLLSWPIFTKLATSLPKVPPVILYLQRGLFDKYFHFVKSFSMTKIVPFRCPIMQTMKLHCIVCHRPCVHLYIQSEWLQTYLLTYLFWSAQLQTWHLQMHVRQDHLQESSRSFGTTSRIVKIVANAAGKT